MSACTAGGPGSTSQGVDKKMLLKAENLRGSPRLSTGQIYSTMFASCAKSKLVMECSGKRLLELELIRSLAGAPTSGYVYLAESDRKILDAAISAAGTGISPQLEIRVFTVRDRVRKLCSCNGLLASMTALAAVVAAVATLVSAALEPHDSLPDREEALLVWLIEPLVDQGVSPDATTLEATQSVLLQRGVSAQSCVWQMRGNDEVKILNPPPNINCAAEHEPQWRKIWSWLPRGAAILTAALAFVTVWRRSGFQQAP